MKYIVYLFIFFISSSAFSQRNLQEEPIFTPIFGLNYKANFSGGDMLQRWGFTNTIGGDIDFKIAIIIAICYTLFAWVGAKANEKVSEKYVVLSLAILMLFTSFYFFHKYRLVASGKDK